MAKTRVTPDRFPTYREALLAMRSRTHADVREVIRDAHSSLPARVRSKASNGEHLQHLFDGIVAAIADQIMAAAEEGNEVEMADLVGEMLTAKVRSRVRRRRM